MTFLTVGGILAVLGPSDKALREKALAGMAARAPHRGALSCIVDEDLAIGAQSLGWDASLASRDNWVAACHGYIGNWDELECTRGTDGTDAEKMLVAFARMGDRLLPRLRGEFSVLLINRASLRVVAFRDVLGCRPLFLRTSGERVYLASEIRQTLAPDDAPARVEPDVLLWYFANRESPRRETICRGVYRVLPAHRLEASLRSPAQTMREIPYWSPPEEDRRDDFDEQELALELRRRFEKAVARGVPKGRQFAVALSGGLDSTILWGLIAARGGPIAQAGRPISLVYPGLACDERPLIELMAAATNAKPIYIDASGLRMDVEMERLVPRLGMLTHHTLYQLGPILDAARNDGRRVLLTGLGPDEWLHGSTRFLARRLIEGDLGGFCRDWVACGWPWLPPWSKYVRAEVRAALRSSLCAVPLFRRLSRLRHLPRWLTRQAKQRLLAQHSTPAERCVDPARQRPLAFLDRCQSGAALEAIELISALSSVETQHPFYDLDLVEFGFSVPFRALTSGRQGKNLQRVSAADILPPAIRDNPHYTCFDSVLERPIRELARRPTQLVVACRALLDSGLVVQEALIEFLGRVSAGNGSLAEGRDVLNLAIAQFATRSFE